jgi:hypothetical protein
MMKELGAHNNTYPETASGFESASQTVRLIEKATRNW